MPEASRAVFVGHRLINTVNIGKIVTIHYFEFDRSFTFEGEEHDFWEMVYIDSGEAVATAGSVSRTLGQGSAIFHCPGEFHKICADGKHAANVFIISFETSSRAMSFFKGKVMTVPQKLRPFIAGLVSESRASFDLPLNDPYLRQLKLRENPPLGGQQMIRTYLEQLLLLLMRHEEQSASTLLFSDRESMHHHLIGAIISIMKKNLYASVTVEQICRELSYSRAYLSKIFKAACGMSMNEYYMKMKIDEARSLIRDDMYTFSQISDMLFFNNPHYFTRVFKKYCNMTPREYVSSVGG